MYLLITTPRFILGYDTGDGKLDVLSSGGGYYGLTWNPQGTEIALTQNYYEGKLDTLAQEAMSDCGYVSVGDRRTVGFLSMPHQALWVGDAHIVVPNTGRNAIARISVQDMSVVQIRYDNVTWDRNDPRGKGAHYNSVFFDGEFIYFVGHNYAATSFIVKAEWPSLELMERIDVPSASGIHNLWIDPAGSWIACDSNHGALIDAKNGERLWDSRGEGFVRGIAVTDDLVIVGNSEKSARDLRQVTAAGIWLIDRKTFALLDYIHLGHFGVVHEVRVSDVPDLAHHGRPLTQAALAGLRNSQKLIRASKLERARATVTNPAMWRSQVGTFLVENGLNVAKDGQFALMASRDPGVHADCDIAARVHVRRWDDGSHADLVLRYTGPEDLSMYAAIVQSKGVGALVVSLWVEDGGWTRIGTAAIPQTLLSRFDLERRGLPVTFAARGRLLTVKVDDEIVLEISDSRLVGGVAGLRMVGDALAVGDFRVSAGSTV